MTGVGTHGTHFGKLLYVQALAAHGNQLFVFKNAIVVSKINGSRAKGTGIGQRRQLQHLLYVAFLQGNGFNEIHRAAPGRIKDQLQPLYFMQQLPAFGAMNFAGCGVQDGAAGRKDVIQLFKAFFIPLVKAGKRRHSFIKELHVFRSETKMPVSRDQTLVNRVI